MRPATKEKAGSGSVDLPALGTPSPFPDNRRGLAYSADDARAPGLKLLPPELEKIPAPSPSGRLGRVRRAPMRRPGRELWPQDGLLAAGSWVRSLSHRKCISRNRPGEPRGREGRELFTCGFLTGGAAGSETQDAARNGEGVRVRRRQSPGMATAGYNRPGGHPALSPPTAGLSRLEKEDAPGLGPPKQD